MRKLAISGFIAPASSREMSSSAPRISSTASSEASTLPTRRASLAAALPLDQAGDVEPRGVERLQDVVARGGEEPRLGDLASSASALARASSALSRVSSVGALAHAPLERLVGALQRFGGLDARRDVGEVVTMPPSGMRLARTSITRPRSAKRSRNGSLPET